MSLQSGQDMIDQRSDSTFLQSDLDLHWLQRQPLLWKMRWNMIAMSMYSRTSSCLSLSSISFSRRRISPSLARTSCLKENFGQDFIETEGNCRKPFIT